MKSLAIGMALTVAALGVVGPRVTEGTNSRRESDRGARAYFAGEHDAAVDAYRRVQRLDPGPVAAFDLGTALVASGDRAHGEQELEKAIEDPALAALAHYNRGNAALDAKAFDDAIREYTSALRMNSADVRFKRNLEIALRKREQQRQQSRQSNGSAGEQPKQDGSQAAGGEDRNGDEMESILRSVEQQEREELRRMLRARAARRPIGW